MAKYTREELVEFQQKIKSLKQEDLSKLSPEELEKLQFLQCPFCQIIDGMIPSKIVYDDKECVAILDINPAIRGHILLLPKHHYLVGPQVPDKLMAHLGVVVKKLSKALMKALKVQGTKIVIANGQSAGQKANHFMIHLIPVESGTNFLNLERHDVNDKDLEEISQNLRIYISKIFGLNNVTEPPREIITDINNKKSKDNEEVDQINSIKEEVPLKILREKGYLYFLDSEGDISRVKMKKKGETKYPHEKVKILNIKREPNLLYYIDSDLNVKTRPMNRRGRPKGVKNKHKHKMSSLTNKVKSNNNISNKESDDNIREKSNLKRTSDGDLRSNNKNKNKSVDLDDIANLFT